MKKCDLFINKEDGLDRYCSMKCDSGKCLCCRVEDAKKLIFQMRKCEAENCELNKCEYVQNFRKILSSVDNKIRKVR